MTILIIVAILLALLLTGTPISIALGATVMVFITIFSSFDGDTVNILSQRLFTGLESFAIMAVPFFILSGTFLVEGGSAAKLVRFAKALVGSLPGGLAISAVLACAFFATVSGSSPATVVAIGSIMLPALVKEGYPKAFSTGVIATSGSLGILIPPSIVLIIYSVSTSQSAGKMFLAGMVPGALLGLLLIGMVYFTAKIKKFPRSESASIKEIWAAFKDAFSGLLLVIIVLGGIYGGVFTPTEAAAISAVYAFFISFVVEKTIGLSQLPKVILSAANTSSMILYIITNAILFSFLLTSEQIPQELALWVVESELSPYMFLLALNILLLVAGQFMEPSAIILILAPLALPIALQLGIDPVHLGIIMTINMEIGMITPPVGLNLFVASHISKMGMTKVAISAFPWAIAMIGFLFLITFVPEISLWLPNLVYE